jgi:hypothetical protein
MVHSFQKVHLLQHDPINMLNKIHQKTHPSQAQIHLLTTRKVFINMDQRDTKSRALVETICRVVVVTKKQIWFVKLIPSVDRPHSHKTTFPLQASDESI